MHQYLTFQAQLYQESKVQLTALLSSAQHCGDLKSQKEGGGLNHFFTPSWPCAPGLPTGTMLSLYHTAPSSAHRRLYCKYQNTDLNVTVSTLLQEQK